MAKIGEIKSDAELAAAFAADGDQKAFAAIVERHGPMVYRACRRIVGDHHQAEDAAQAAFVVFARRAGSYSVRKGDLAGWLFGVARRTALNLRRAGLRRAQREKEAAMRRQAEARAREVQAAATAKAAGILDAALAALPAGQRAAVVRLHLEGMSREEAAAASGCRPEALAMRASRGLAGLRKKLAKRGAALAPAALLTLLTGESALAAPAGLLTTLNAAPALAGGAAGAAAGTAVAVNLAKGVLNAMFWTKVKLAAGVLAALLVATAGTTALIQAADGGEPIQPNRPAPPAKVTPAPTAPAGETGEVEAAGIAWGEEVHGLQLGLSREGEALFPGEEVRVTLHYRNNTGEPVGLYGNPYLVIDNRRLPDYILTMVPGQTNAVPDLVPAGETLSRQYRWAGSWTPAPPPGMPGRPQPVPTATTLRPGSHSLVASYSFVKVRRGPVAPLNLHLPADMVDLTSGQAPLEIRRQAGDHPEPTEVQPRPQAPDQPDVQLNEEAAARSDLVIAGTVLRFIEQGATETNVPPPVTVIRVDRVFKGGPQAANVTVNWGPALAAPAPGGLRGVGNGMTGIFYLRAGERQYDLLRADPLPAALGPRQERVNATAEERADLVIDGHVLRHSLATLAVIAVDRVVETRTQPGLAAGTAELLVVGRIPANARGRFLLTRTGASSWQLVQFLPAE